MLDLQVARLVSAYPSLFSLDEAKALVARAYGYERLTAGWQLDGVKEGFQTVRPYSQILKLDPTHQMMEFIRMALNISLPFGDDLRKGRPEREIISSMLGFTDFDALVNYAHSDPVDPHTTSRDMLARFQRRYGYYAPMQYLLGRYLHNHTLLIQPDARKGHRFIDQELSLNPLQDMRIVVVRVHDDATAWLEQYVPELKSVRGELDSDYQTRTARAMGASPLLVSVLPSQAYRLSALVRAHVNLLQAGRDGRTLIIDQVNLSASNTADIHEAYLLATEHRIHLVVAVEAPQAALWELSAAKMIFGYPAYMRNTNVEMDAMLAYSAHYAGFRKGKMQFLYYSELSGPRFGAMDLIPDDPVAPSVEDRILSGLGLGRSTRPRLS